MSIKNEFVVLVASVLIASFGLGVGKRVVSYIYDYVKNKQMQPERNYENSSSDDANETNSTCNTGEKTTPCVKTTERIIGRTGKIVIDSKIILGKGEQGQVYRGKFENETPAAVKEILHGESEKNYATRQLVRKANQNLLQKHCENIVRYYCFDIEKKTALYICMELCDCDMDNFINNSPDSLPDNSLEQILKGMEFLHDLRLLHRDIKPSNVLVTTNIYREVILKLSDFSISKKMSQLCGVESDLYVGTPNWMAPEISIEISKARTSTSTAPQITFTMSADIFSLGLVCFYIATKGVKLYTSQSVIDNDNNSMSQSEISQLDSQPLKKDMVQRMTDFNASNRPTAMVCLKHPCHWSVETSLDFFERASDWLNAKVMPSAYAVMTSAIESRANQVFSQPWGKNLTPRVHSELFPTRARGKASYDPTKLKSLLRAVRNTKHHIHDMPGLHSEIGTSQKSVLDYWTGRFPMLLLTVHQEFRQLAHRDDFKRFY